MSIILKILERAPADAVACHVSSRMAALLVREAQYGASVFTPPARTATFLRAPSVGGMHFYVDTTLIGDEIRFASEDPRADDHIVRSEN